MNKIASGLLIAVCFVGFGCEGLVTQFAIPEDGITVGDTDMEQILDGESFDQYSEINTHREQHTYDFPEKKDVISWPEVTGDFTVVDFIEPTDGRKQDLEQFDVFASSEVSDPDFVGNFDSIFPIDIEAVDALIYPDFVADDSSNRDLGKDIEQFAEVNYLERSADDSLENDEPQYIDLIGQYDILLPDIVIYSDIAVPDTTVELEHGLVAYYKFDNNVLDSSGHNYHAVNFGAEFDLGIINQCLRFNKQQSDHLSVIENLNAFSFTTATYGSEELTFVVWYNSQTPEFVSKGTETNGNFEYRFYIDANKKLRLDLCSSLDNTCISKASEESMVPYNDTWTFVAVTYDGSKTPDGINLYIDGYQINSISVGDPSYSGMRQENGSVNIANYLSTYTEGMLDEIRIYSRELNLSEIIELYQEGSGVEVDAGTQSDVQGDLFFQNDIPVAQSDLVFPDFSVPTDLQSDVTPTDVAQSDIAQTDVEPQCSQDYHCPYGQFCDNGLCALGCMDTGDCGIGFMCEEQHRCVEGWPCYYELMYSDVQLTIQFYLYDQVAYTLFEEGVSDGEIRYIKFQNWETSETVRANYHGYPSEYDFTIAVLENARVRGPLMVEDNLMNTYPINLDKCLFDPANCDGSCTTYDSEQGMDIFYFRPVQINNLP